MRLAIVKLIISFNFNSIDTNNVTIIDIVPPWNTCPLQSATEIIILPPNSDLK